MECPDCEGKDKKCIRCNGSGYICNVCGEATDDGSDICDECEEEEDDDEDFEDDDFEEDEDEDEDEK